MDKQSSARIPLDYFAKCHVYWFAQAIQSVGRVRHNKARVNIKSPMLFTPGVDFCL